MKNLIQVVNGKNVTTSLLVAENFGRTHTHILRDIDKVVGDLEGVTKNGYTPLFTKSEYLNEQNGQHYPMYYMDRDAFCLLVMGFNNTRNVLEWKLKYIQAFNTMEEKLKTAPSLSDPRESIAKLIVKSTAPQISAIKELYPEYFPTSTPTSKLESTVDRNTSYLKWKEDYNITLEWVTVFPTSDIYNSYKSYCVENFYHVSLGKKEFYRALEWDFNLAGYKQRSDGRRYFVTA